MKNRKLLNVLARIWFLTAIGMTFTAFLLSSSSHAMNIFGKPDQPAPQLGGGSTGGGTSVGAASQNADNFSLEKYLINYSDLVFEKAERGEVSLTDSRIKTTNRIEDALDSRLSSAPRSVLLQGGSGSGKTHAVDQYILSHPEQEFWKLDLNELSSIPKENQAALLKKVLIDFEQKNKNHLGKKMVFFVDNLLQLDAPAGGITKPLSAIVDAITNEREINFVLETQASTLPEIKDNEKLNSRLIKIEMEGPKQIAIEDYLRDFKIKNNLPISEEAISESAKLALKYRRGNPFAGAAEFLTDALNRVEREAREGKTQLAKVKSDLAAVRKKIQSLSSDIQFFKQATADQISNLEALQAQEKSLALKEAELKVHDSQATFALQEYRQQKKSLELSLANETDARERKNIQTSITQLSEKIETLQNEITRASNAYPVNYVTADKVQEAAADKLGMPKSALSVDFETAVSEIDKINDRVVNQEHIVEFIKTKLSGALIRQKQRQAMKDRGDQNVRVKPLLSMIVAGRTGTGKTEIATLLAKAFGVKILRFDFSQFSESHSVSKLIGSPPGYEGSKEGGQLTNALQNQPFQVLLIDEFDMAHSNVLNLFYPILDDAILTDGKGNTISLENTVIIFTTNKGQEIASMNKEQLITAILESVPEGEREKVKEELSKRSLNDLKTSTLKKLFGNSYAEALIGRVDALYVTNDHDSNSIKQIANILLRENAALLKQTANVRLLVSEPAFEAISKTFSPSEGARSLVKTINRLTQDEIGKQLGSKKLPDGSAIILDFVDGKFTLDLHPEGNLLTAFRYTKRLERALDKSSRNATVSTETKYFNPQTERGRNTLFNDEYLLSKGVAEVMRRFGRR